MRDVVAADLSPSVPLSEVGEGEGVALRLALMIVSLRPTGDHPHPFDKLRTGSSPLPRRERELWDARLGECGVSRADESGTYCL